MSGFEEELPATLGGNGWLPRLESHCEELRRGKYWSSCGLDSEAGPLTAVAVAFPPESLSGICDPNSALALRRPDLKKIRCQFKSLVSFLKGLGVRVHVLSEIAAPPNILFMRDLFLMTPAGAIIARPASLQRADEPRLVSRFLANNGFPIIGTVTGSGTFEGADCLWLSPDRVMIGVGVRTNISGAKQVARLLRGIGVSAELVRLPSRTQHLLGVVNFLDKDVAAVDQELISLEVLEVLHGAGIATLDICERGELIDHRALNFLQLGGGRILAPAGPVASYRRYAEVGVEVHTIEVSEYIACAGAIGCAVGIIQR